MKSQKGFTLIELLVVIAILGVLAAIVVPNVAKFIGKGNVEAANVELATVETGVVAFMAENKGVVPGNVTAIMPYLMKPPVGVYTIGSDDGLVTGTTYEGLEWDGDNHAWKEID